MPDPKARFKQYVGKESGGGRPKGQGYITERQRQGLQVAHLDYLVERNKKKGHFPKRVPDAEWAVAKEKLKQRHQKAQVQGDNLKAAKKKAPKKPAPKKTKSGRATKKPSRLTPS